ncbi:hypothetical protein GCK32_020960, partial [Trichostrongylus colubriformis]
SGRVVKSTAKNAKDKPLVNVSQCPTCTAAVVLSASFKMNRWLMSILLLALLNGVTTNVFKNCYDNWSRCTTQTSFGTGILWKSCPEYCQKCKGRATGECVQVFNQYCSGGYQCQLVDLKFFFKSFFPRICDPRLCDLRCEL